MKTLYYGGDIITMTEPLYAEAVLTENGKVLSAGFEKDMRRLAGECEEVNLNGSVLMPAFIDSHSHFFQVAASFLQVSLDGADSVSEIGKRIAGFIEENKIEKGQWVNARDYDNNIMPEYKNPDLAELDSFAPDNPLIIQHKSGHMGLLNSAAAQELGIDENSKSPEGGRIEVKDGKFTGYLEENAFIEILKKAPMPGPEQLLAAFVKAQDKYASYGITTIQEGMIVEQMLPVYRLLAERKLLKLDVMLYPAIDSYKNVKDFVDSLSNEKHLHIGGMKMFLDGSPQGRTAWMRKPYEGDSAYCGYGTMTDEAVEKAFEKAAQEHVQLLAHCNGDAAAEQFLRCLERAEKKYPELRQLRPVIIHGQLIGRDQLKRVQDLGAMISFFAAHVWHWGDVHVRNFGMERAKCISPAKSALKEGVTFTFHQDAPVIEPDMLETVWCAVNRITKSGTEFEEKISVLDALKAVTVNGAYQYFRENSMGSIEQGNAADFVILNRNLLKTPNMELRNIRVLSTLKDGRVVYKA